MAYSKKTVSFPDKMMERLKELAKKWNVSESEVLRRFFGVADFFVTEVEDGKELYSEKEGERTKLILPF